MPGIHRATDSRTCGAATLVTNQSTVFAEGLLCAVNGDPNDHGSGELIASGSTVFIEGKAVVIAGDNASPDTFCLIVGPPHCNPQAVGKSGTVFAY